MTVLEITSNSLMLRQSFLIAALAWLSTTAMADLAHHFAGELSSAELKFYNAGLVMEMYQPDNPSAHSEALDKQAEAQRTAYDMREFPFTGLGNEQILWHYFSLFFSLAFSPLRRRRKPIWGARYFVTMLFNGEHDQMFVAAPDWASTCQFVSGIAASDCGS